MAVARAAGTLCMKEGEKMKRVMIAISAACWRRALAATDSIVKQLHVDAQARSAEPPIPEAAGMYGFWLRAVGYKKAVIACYLPWTRGNQKALHLKWSAFYASKIFAINKPPAIFEAEAWRTNKI